MYLNIIINKNNPILFFGTCQNKHEKNRKENESFELRWSVSPGEYTFSSYFQDGKHVLII